MRTLLTAAGALALRALAGTLRWRIAGLGRIHRLLRAEAPVVFVLWHGAGPLLLLCRTLPRVTILVSQSADGDLATGVLDRLDQRVIRGSTSRGGAGALRRMLRSLRREHRPTITLDGPRGPRHQVGPGAAHLARLGGAWLVPLGAHARHRVQLRSWDRATLPLPGSAAGVAIGRPLRWRDADDPTGFEELLRQRLDVANQRARRLCGPAR